METVEHRSTTVFRNYLRVKSGQPNPDYVAVVEFLENYAESCGFPCRIYETVPGMPVVIMTIEGTDPSLSSILLKSHTDVGQVFPEYWMCDPFSATKDEDGNIYARGSQDMKCVGIQHLEAMREFSEEGVKLLRTVHIAFLPDEDVGGERGMKIWIDTDDFRSLNVGLALDEGMANPGEELRVFYSERLVRWAAFVAKGTPGHAAKHLEKLAAPKLHKLMGKVMQFQNEENARLDNDPNLYPGDVSTINITSLKGGVQPNVVPDHMEVHVDLRLTPLDKERVEKMFDDWCTECDVSIRWLHMQKEIGMTSTDPSDIWWKALSGALERKNCKYTKEVFYAFTDSRYLRDRGIPAFGFSPMNRTPILLHEHNECLNEKVFLEGVQIMKAIAQDVANARD